MASIARVQRSGLATIIYSYAYEFHQALAILSMLSRGGKNFAWGSGLLGLRSTCLESEKVAVQQRLLKEALPLIDKCMATVKRLGVRVPYVTRESIMQVPSNADLRKMLALQIRGQRNRISSVTNEYSNMLERTTRILVEEEKKTEIVTELVDKVPGKDPKNFQFPGEPKEGVQLFRLYVVPQQRLAIHRCFVRSIAIPKYQTDILNIDPDVKISQITFTLDKKNTVKNITYKD